MLHRTFEVSYHDPLDILKKPFKSLYGLENFFFGFDQSEVHLLVVGEHEAVLSKISADICRPHGDNIEIWLKTEDNGRLKRHKDFSKYIASLVPNPYKRPVVKEGIKIFSRMSMYVRQAVEVLTESAFRLIPLAQNAFVSVTHQHVVIACIEGDIAHCFDYPADSIKARFLTEAPPPEHICPRDQTRIRCCMSCEHSEGGEACILKQMDPYVCCLELKKANGLPTRMKNSVDRVMARHASLIMFMIAFLDYTNIVDLGVI